jgi:hypothetical protein
MEPRENRFLELLLLLVEATLAGDMLTLRSGYYWIDRLAAVLVEDAA